MLDFSLGASALPPRAITATGTMASDALLLRFLGIRSVGMLRSPFPQQCAKRIERAPVRRPVSASRSAPHLLVQVARPSPEIPGSRNRPGHPAGELEQGFRRANRVRR